MAFVVRRPGDRWEIRESSLTPAGPRARTLASFKHLSDDVIARAAGRAQGAFDRDELIGAARRAGVPFERHPADATAETLIRMIARGSLPRPGLRRLLRDTLGGEPARIDGSLAEWIGASPEERGRALVDLLGLADRLPKPRRTRLTFPGLSRARLRR